MLRPLNCHVIKLRSGVPAMRDLRYGITMHCGSGPGVEPSEVYVNPSRLAARLAQSGDPLVLFDVGLGAASNALAAFHVSQSLPLSARRLEIVSFDNDLYSLHLALDPAHRSDFGFADDQVEQAMQTLISTGIYETPRTTWRLSLGDFAEQLAIEKQAQADIIFWDMYSARSCPALWTVEMFENLKRACRSGATLHTTNTATSSRVALLLGGFFVGAGPKTGERSHTTMASLNLADLEDPLGEDWFGRLTRSHEAFPPDMAQGALEKLALVERVRNLPQFSVLR